MATSDISTLLDNAKCFRCLSHKELIAIQTYIIAYASDQGMDPDTLLNEARCLLCLSPKQLFQIRAYLIANIGGLSTDPQELAGLAQCYRCIPDGYLEAVRAYLFSLDANGPGITDPDVLEANAATFKGLTPEQSLAIQVYLLANNAGLSTDPGVLQDLAKCFDCLSFEVLNSVTTQVIDEVENNGGINGGGGTPCVDVPAEQIPVITGIYTDGTLTGISILLPQVCCNPQSVTIYEADDAIGTGAVAIASAPIADSHAGEINYVLPDYTFAAPPAKDWILVTQTCDGGTESGYSNAVEVDATCGVASSVIEVTGAGEVDANGFYVWSQAEYDSSGRFVYINPATDWFIEFTNGVGGVEAYLYNDAVAVMYHLLLGECFPCGEWSNTGGDLGALPVPTCQWDTTAVAAADDWADRVEVNGGTRPSVATITAAAVFYGSLRVNNILSKMLCVNFIAPDNKIAAATPFIKTIGTDPWTGEAIGGNPFGNYFDLTINGVDVNGPLGSASWLPGINPLTHMTQNNCGITIYGYTNAAMNDFTVESGAGGVYFSFWTNYANTTSASAIGGFADATYASVSWTPLNGYYSANRVSNVSNVIYFANSVTAHVAKATAVGNNANLMPNDPIRIISTSGGGTWANYVFSFVAFHEGLTAAESAKLYAAVQSLRTAFGGGYI